MNWTEPFKIRNPNGQKTHEKMLTTPGRKGNANQNHVKIPCSNVNYYNDYGKQCGDSSKN
jgi:hypothetical protein